MLLALAISVLAGSLTSPGTPDATSSLTMEDIYNRLNSGTSGTAITFTGPTSGPGVTMHTLNEIMATAPRETVLLTLMCWQGKPSGD